MCVLQTSHKLLQLQIQLQIPVSVLQASKKLTAAEISAVTGAAIGTIIVCYENLPQIQIQIQVQAVCIAG